jgi:TetR/AcrR family transcriptional repressor of nem operon
MPRQSRAVRRTFTEGLLRNLERTRAKLSKTRKRTREDDVLALVSSMVGALILARAVDDPQLSDRILTASRKRLLEEFA